MTRKDVLLLLKDCIFDNYLTPINYEHKIIDHLPKDYPFTFENGISRLVIIPLESSFVIKIPFNANRSGKFSWDYCLKEMLLYREAKKDKINYLFLKPTLVGQINNHPIYMEPKAQTYEDVWNCSISPSDDYFPDDWIEDAVCCYGESLIDRFLAFMSGHDIYADMHEGNFGWANDRPVLIDYAGFIDEQ